MKERVAIVGAGIGGLSCALALAGRGFEVALYERDRAASGREDAAAIAQRRRGVPQAVHPHFFMGRLREALRARHPELLARLARAGAGEGSFLDALHPVARGRYAARADDAALTSIAARRTTFEHAMRAYVEEKGFARIESAAPVVGLLVEPGAIPRVRGLRVQRAGAPGAEEIPADVVIDASGRASELARELAAAGIELVEERHDAGIVYFTRHYALLPGQEAPTSHGIPGLIFPDFIVGALPSDRGAFTVTYQVQRDDAGMVAVVRDPERFHALCLELPAIARWVDPARARPTSDVFGFGGMDSFWRNVVVGGEPRVLGLHFVGDAAVRSNPKYGRGCTWSYLGAELLADVLAGESSAQARAVRYAAALEQRLRADWRTMLALDGAARGRFEIATGARRARLAERARGAFADLVDEAQLVDAELFRAIWSGYHGFTGMSDWTHSPAAWLRLGRHALLRRVRAPLLAERRARPTRAEILDASRGPRRAAN